VLLTRALASAAYSAAYFRAFWMISRRLTKLVFLATDFASALAAACFANRARFLARPSGTRDLATLARAILEILSLVFCKFDLRL